MTDFVPFKAARTVGFKCVCVMNELFKAARTVGFKCVCVMSELFQTNIPRNRSGAL